MALSSLTFLIAFSSDFSNIFNLIYNFLIWRLTRALVNFISLEVRAYYIQLVTYHSSFDISYLLYYFTVGLSAHHYFHVIFWYFTVRLVLVTVKVFLFLYFLFFRVCSFRRQNCFLIVSLPLAILFICLFLSILIHLHYNFFLYINFASNIFPSSKFFSFSFSGSLCVGSFRLLKVYTG